MRGWVPLSTLIVLLALGPVAPTLGASPTVPPAVITGTIASVATDVIAVTTAAGPKRVRMTATTRVGNWVPARLEDIKASDVVGVTARKEINSSLTAEEIHIFPAGRQIQARQFPWTNGTIMTNAPVTSVVSAVSARTITLTYQGRAVKINVPGSTDIRRITSGTRDELKMGTHIRAFGRANDDGSLTATSVIVYQGR